MFAFYCHHWGCLHSIVRIILRLSLQISNQTPFNIQETGHASPLMALPIPLCTSFRETQKHVFLCSYLCFDRISGCRPELFFTTRVLMISLLASVFLGCLLFSFQNCFTVSGMDKVLLLHSIVISNILSSCRCRGRRGRGGYGYY